MTVNTKRIHNSFWINFPGRAKQMPSSDLLFVGKKTRRPLGHCLSKIVIVGNSKWVKNRDFCAQLSHCFSLGSVNTTTSHLHFGE